LEYGWFLSYVSQSSGMDLDVDELASNYYNFDHYFLVSSWLVVAVVFGMDTPTIQEELK